MKNNIKEVIKRKQRTQDGLAKEAGIKREYLNRIINNHIAPSVYLALRIAGALNVSVEDLFVL